MVPLIAAFLLLGLFVAPTATAASNGFATLIMTGFPESDGSPTDVKATVNFKNGTNGDVAYRYLVVYRTSSTHVKMQLESATLEDGAPANIEQHNRNASVRESRMWIRGAGGAGYSFEGTAQTDSNGRFHIGVLVIPFDKEWKQVKNKNGTNLQIYEYTLLSGIGVKDGPLFIGSGNAPAASSGFAILFVALAAWAARGSRGNS